MKVSLVICLLSAVLAMMISGAVSLPPDFFRAGRGDSGIPAGKRASTELKLFEDACNFCQTHDPQLRVLCQQSAGVQKVCLMAYVTELHSFLDKKGWA